MFASIFILTFSVAALGYWAWSAARAVLRRDHRREAAQLAEANRLEFVRVRQALEAASALPEADSLRDALQRDFRVLSYMLRYAATLHVGRYTAQECALVMDFHLMRFTYLFAKRFSPGAARRALLEMTSILEYFAAVLSRRLHAFGGAS